MTRSRDYWMAMAATLMVAVIVVAVVGLVALMVWATLR